ncbi:MAG: signal recognition particle subunit SRP19/SEC65 family protein [Thermoprotei archaeon]|nr:signal recognition particle subunit SRP19/SEC65 family protein [TACK group archaeon]
MTDFRVWPVYLDASKSRSQGRKLAVSMCVKKPTAQELLEAAVHLGLRARLEAAKYPRDFYAEGRIAVEWDGKKSQLLKKIGVQIKKRRGGS